jgi:Cdc6-like AAA superfamily ATPase
MKEDKFVTESPDQLAIMTIIDNQITWISQPELFEQYKLLVDKPDAKRQSFSQLLQKLELKGKIRKRQIAEFGQRIPTNYWNRNNSD